MQVGTSDNRFLKKSYSFFLQFNESSKENHKTKFQKNNKKHFIQLNISCLIIKKINIVFEVIEMCLATL